MDETEAEAREEDVERWRHCFESTPHPMKRSHDESHQTDEQATPARLPQHPMRGAEVEWMRKEREQETERTASGMAERSAH